MKKSDSIDISGYLSRSRQQCGCGLQKSGRGQKFARDYLLYDPPYLMSWGPRSEWSGCSHTCGEGNRLRLESCLDGDFCEGNSTDYEECNATLGNALQVSIY